MSVRARWKKRVETNERNYKKKLLELYDLRCYRDKLYKEIEQHTGIKYKTHPPVNFLSWSSFTLRYISNLDWFFAGVQKYLTNELPGLKPEYVKALQKYIIMSNLDLDVRNERIAVVDEITRAHSKLNNVLKNHLSEEELPSLFPDAVFEYPDLGNSHPWFDDF